MSLKPGVSPTDHSTGKTNAPVELVEFGDYECPHCGAAHPVIKRLQDQLGSDLLFVFRNFPLSNVHPHAVKAATAAEAAALQGRFWEMHDEIFEHQDHLDTVSLFRYAEQVDLDMDRFNEDIGDLSLPGKIEEDFESGVRSGVNGTPSFFVNGHPFTGDWTGDGLLRYIRENILKT